MDGEAEQLSLLHRGQMQNADRCQELAEVRLELAEAEKLYREAESHVRASRTLCSEPCLW